MKIILQKFAERILYGFGFGLGMGASLKLLRRQDNNSASRITHAQRTWDKKYIEKYIE